MKHIILLTCFALFFCSSKSVFAQSDTILVGYSQTDFVSSFINEMIILPGNKIGFTQTTIAGPKAFVTDTKGQVIYQRALDYVDGYVINSSSYIFDDTSRYVYIGNAMRNGKRYFISYSLDTTLQEIRLIDTVQVENDVRVFTNMMKYNTYKSVWEGFGSGENVSIPSTEYICYLSLDENYEFKKFERLHGNYQESLVIEFQWIESLGRYFVKPFNDRSLLVDEEFNVVREIVGITLVYEYNGTHITSLGMYNCLEPEGSTMFCYAKEDFNWPYNAAFATLDLQGDSIHLVEAVPLSDPPLGMNVGSQMRVDLDGNYVISGVMGFNPPNPNTVRVAKFSSVTYEKIWEFSYQSDICFAIWDMEIDQNNDIILVGHSWNIFGDGQPRGFLMKVYSNGALSSYYGVPDDLSDVYWVQVSPNPASSALCLRAATQPQTVRLWDVSGRLALERPVGLSDIDGQYCFDLPPALQPGFYSAEVLFPDGQRVVRKVVVQNQ
ncbi:MAG: hypothetical protein ACKVUS_04045 [Saprospiraceae bacterium]